MRRRSRERLITSGAGLNEWRQAALRDAVPDHGLVLRALTVSGDGAAPPVLSRSAERIGSGAA